MTKACEGKSSPSQHPPAIFHNMKWLRNVVVDLVATLVILMWVVQGWDWAGWAVWIYTPLMLVLKIAALTLGRLLGRANRGDVPAWFYHFVYAANVALLGYGAQYVSGRWILAAMWVAIWALSVWAVRRARQRRPQRRMSETLRVPSHDGPGTSSGRSAAKL